MGVKSMNGLNARLWINNIQEAVRVLDDHVIKNDIDGGGRVMVSENDLSKAVEILEYEGFDVDMI